MLIVILAPAHAPEASAAVQGDGGVVGGPDLQCQKCQVVGLSKVKKHLQQLSGACISAWH